MTGAAIVRWEAGDAVVLAVHGAFDGASAWALCLAMDECPGREFVVDLGRAEEACDFAAGILSTWARGRAREKRVRFRAGTPEHERLLAGHGLELVAERSDADAASRGELAAVVAGTPVPA